MICPHCNGTKTNGGVGLDRLPCRCTRHPRQFEMNLNHKVRFKLTLAGQQRVQQLEEWLTEYPEFRLTSVLNPPIDGWYETQLWVFMHDWGPTLSIGFSQYVDPNIILLPE